MSVAGQEMFSRLRVNVRSSRRKMLGRESGTHPFPTLCPEASIRCKEQRPESRERLRGRGIREREQDSLVPRICIPDFERKIQYTLSLSQEVPA